MPKPWNGTDDISQRILFAQGKGYFKSPMPESKGVDFWSNDYLGVLHDKELQQNLVDSFLGSKLPIGSSGSRLVSGNLDLYSNLESSLAEWTKAEAALWMPSAYTANLLLLQTLPQRNDLVLFDAEIHASLRDGLQLSPAKHQKFPHQDWDSLEQALKKYKDQRVYVLIESVYSMSGDQAKAKILGELQQKYGFRLLVDEVHAGGLLGPNGSGWFNQYASDVEVFARVFGFGKAFGSSGGAIVGNLELINLLKGTGRGYIYTTAPSPFSAHQVLKLLEKPEILENKRTALERLCIQADHFLPASESPWLRFLRCKEANAPSNLALKWFGPPTVPSEKCGYRIILHAHNSVEECEELKKWIWDAHPQYS